MHTAFLMIVTFVIETGDVRPLPSQHDAYNDPVSFCADLLMAKRRHFNKETAPRGYSVDLTSGTLVEVDCVVTPVRVVPVKPALIRSLEKFEFIHPTGGYVPASLEKPAATGEKPKEARP